MKFKTLLMTAGCTLGLLATGAALATDAGTVRSNFLKNTGLEAETVRATPVPGIWEVFIQERMFYVDDSARYIISGRLIDATTQEDLTQVRLREIARSRWSEWPYQDAVKQVFGKGEREVIVFSDANCTYCRMMEKAYAEVGNLTVWTFIVPMLRGEENAREIVCSKDRSKAWHEWMGQGIRPVVSVAGCDTSVLQRNLALAHRYNVTAAPTFFFKSGDRSTGAMPSYQLNKILEEVK